MVFVLRNCFRANASKNEGGKKQFKGTTAILNGETASTKKVGASVFTANTVNLDPNSKILQKSQKHYMDLISRNFKSQN